MKNERRTILYIAMSLDGYIAKPNDDLGFLSMVEAEGEDYGYTDFVQSVDTVILGRRTYDWIMAQVPVFPHADLKTYVITRTAMPGMGLTEFYTGDIKTLIGALKRQEGKNIFIDGGAMVVNLMLSDGLIDELIISIIPILVGDGIRLFSGNNPEQPLVLKDVKKFDSGLVQLHYLKK